MAGTLALVGGGAWSEGCDFDVALLEEAGGGPVVVLPTAAAYEHPTRVVDAAAAWFAGLGAEVVSLGLLGRADASDPDIVSTIAEARFLYLGDGSPMHLRSVLKDSPAWDAVLASWQGGAVLAGTGAGAAVLTDPMVDPRGGAFTLGLGAVGSLAVVPGIDAWSEDKVHRTRTLAPKGIAVAGIDARTALLRGSDGPWRSAGAGTVRVWRAGEVADLTALP